MKFAQAGEFIEEALRDISNYILAVFSSVFRYINGAFSGFVVPIRNAFVGFIETVGGALGKFVGMFSENWQNAINGALDGLRELKDEANRLSAKTKTKVSGRFLQRKFPTRRAGTIRATDRICLLRNRLIGTRSS